MKPHLADWRRVSGPVRLVGACAMILLYGWSSTAQADQRVRFQVALGTDAVLSEVRVDLVRLGENRSVYLLDDGSIEGDMPWDGVFVGEDAGPYARFMAVRLVVREGGGEENVVLDGVARTEDERVADVGWRLVRRPGGALAARWAAVTWPGNRMAEMEGMYVLACFGWGLLVLTYLGILVRSCRGRP